MNSMTGFGFEEGNGELGYYRVNLKSLNHRFCDIHLRLPRELAMWEESLMTYIREKISRGKIEVRITFEPRTEAFSVETNTSLARSYLEGLHRISQELDIPFEPDLKILLQVGEIIELKKDDQQWNDEWAHFLPLLDAAFKSFCTFRENEGKALQKDLLSLLNKVRENIQKVETNSGEVKESYRKKLTQKVQEILPNSPVNEALLAQELVYYVERSDIHEEIIRMKSHLTRMEKLLFKTGAVGRELEFVLQEMNREVNTIGSKTGSAAISSLVIDMKSLLEKMREQIQNVE